MPSSNTVLLGGHLTIFPLDFEDSCFLLPLFTNVGEGVFSEAVCEGVTGYVLGRGDMALTDVMSGEHRAQFVGVVDEYTALCIDTILAQRATPKIRNGLSSHFM